MKKLIYSQEDLDLILSLENENKDKEIERLKIIEEKYKDSQLYIKDFKDEIERLNNIIEEVREYIKENKIYAELVDYEKNGEYYIDEIGLLDILDKESQV